MAKIGTGRYAEAVRRLLAIRGTLEAPVTDVAPELAAAIIVESDRPEFKFLSGTKQVSVHRRVNAVAAEFGEFRLINPPGSGVIHVIEQVSIHKAGNGMFLFMLPLNSANLADTAGMTSCDSRWGSLNIGAVTSSRGSNVALNPLGGRSIHFWGALAGADSFWTRPIVLAPGGGIELQMDTVNVDFEVNVDSYERALDRFER